MTPQMKAAEALLDELNAEFDINIVFGSLPQNGGISAEIAGESDSRNLNIRHGRKELTVLFLCKNTSQSAAYDLLTRIGEYIAEMSPQPENGILGGKLRNGAGLVGNQDGYYIYSLTAAIIIAH